MLVKGPVSHNGYEQRYKYQEFVKRYLTEQGIPLSPWESVKPLYLRYRGRCLKNQPETYEQFLHLCTFEPLRKTKYDDQGNLKDGCKQGWNKTTQPLEDVNPKGKEKREYAGVSAIGQRARASFKLNYKAPPKKEDFEYPMEWRRAYYDWTYLRDELVDYAAVKAVLNKPVNKRKPDLIPNKGCGGKRYHYMFELPWLIKYALKCLSGVYPAECFPEPLNGIKEELKELLNKQKEAYSKSESETILNDLIKYLEETKS